MERNLTAQGRIQAESIGRWMSKSGILPDWIICSSAKRTKLTAKICSERVGYQRSIRFESGLYEADSGKYLEIISALNDKYDSVMIVGHNPAISAVVAILTGVQLDMSECMLACIGFTTDQWISFKDDFAKLKWFQIPS
ncbi:MAG: histidine phosphatase family protein [Syntrophales bacterium LBB04]|nr:histidine phosphatase family protein [Syntrophales bacterium LBB04]